MRSSPAYEPGVRHAPPLRMHLVHDVVLARVLNHLEPKIVVRPHFGGRSTINLKRLHLLSEVGGMSVDVNLIANTQRSGLDPNYCDRQVVVIVRDDADALLPWGGLRGRTRRGRRAWWRWPIDRR